MYIAQITKIRLHPDADTKMSARTYGEVEAWLKQWTPQNNFQAVIANTQEDAHNMLCDTLLYNLLPGIFKHVPIVCFQFRRSMQHVQNNRFWMPSCVGVGSWHDIVEVV